MEWTEDKINELSEESQLSIRETINKYPNNYWWESCDLREVAKWQLFEPILMVDFTKLHEGIEILLDRPVWTHEFAFADTLRKEVMDMI